MLKYIHIQSHFKLDIYRYYKDENFVPFTPDLCQKVEKTFTLLKC